MTLIGNEVARAELLGAIERDAMHHAWLLAGPQGVGKATFARMAAARILGTTPEDPLLRAGSHPDYRELRRLPKDADKPDQDLARSVTIAQVRGLLPLFATRPSLGTRRAILIDAIDDVERPGASNALLKSLEEPPAGTVFLLVSHAPGRLLPTIRSRCRLLRFGRLTDGEVAAAVKDRLPDISDSELNALLGVADGSPGRAMAMAGLAMDAIDAALADIANTGDPDNAGRSALATSLAAKIAQARYEAFLERVPTLIAERARHLTGAALLRALNLHEEARGVARIARAQSLDAQGTVFELAGLVAALPRG